MVLSGLQKSVLSLYRQCLRMARTKKPQFRPHWEAFISEFRRNQGVSKRNFYAIEHLLRVGKRKYETYSRPEVEDVTF